MKLAKKPITNNFNTMINPNIDNLIKLLAKSYAQQWIEDKKLKDDKKNVKSLSLR